MIIIWAAAVLYLALSTVLNGYVLSVLWSWFVTPTFHLPPLAIAPAIGIALIVELMANKSKPDENTEFQALLSFIWVCICPLFALGIGWVVQRFM